MSGYPALRSLAAPLSLFVAVACGGSDNFAGTIETLPDGRVRVTNPEQGIWSSGGEWQLVQDLAIGVAEGEDAEVFAQIAAIQADDAGRIYVLDRQANELRIFAPDGSHVRTVGRSGGGPGEYSNANGLMWLTPDSLLVIDQRGRRYSVLSRDGDFMRSVPRLLGFYSWIPSVAFLNGRVYELSSIRDSDVSVPVILGTSLGGQALARDPAAAADEKASVSLIPAVDTVRLPMPKQSRIEPFTVRNPRAMMVMGVPFSPLPVYYVDSAGNLWHGHGSEWRIYRSTLAGDTTLEITVAATPASVSPEELRKWEAGEGIKQFREMGGELDMARIPKVKPYFDGLYVDPDGYVWVSVPAGANETVFAILDPQGRYHGKLAIPGIRREPSVPPVVRNGLLYLAARDEMDVPRVLRYRINGP